MNIIQNQVFNHCVLRQGSKIIIDRLHSLIAVHSVMLIGKRLDMRRACSLVKGDQKPRFAKCTVSH